MFERMASQENKSSADPEAISRLVKGKLDSFIKLYKDTHGEPGEVLTREKEVELEERAKTEPEARKRLASHGESVYRINKLTSALGSINLLLESKNGEKIPKEFKEKFSEVMERVNHIHDVRFSEEEQAKALSQIKSLDLSDPIKNSLAEKIGRLLERGQVSRLELNGVFRSEANSMTPEEKRSFVEAENGLLIEKKFDEAEEGGDLLITKDVIDAVVDLIKETYQYLK